MGSRRGDLRSCEAVGQFNMWWEDHTVTKLSVDLDISIDLLMAQLCELISNLKKIEASTWYACAYLGYTYSYNHFDLSICNRHLSLFLQTYNLLYLQLDPVAQVWEHFVNVF